MLLLLLISACLFVYLCLCPSVSQEDSEVFVEDYSNNGTFVDGNLIGKNKKLPLVNNAVLALAEQRNKGQGSCAHM